MFGPSRFCCVGCESVFELLSREGLGRYYDLKDQRIPASTALAAPSDHTWLDPLLLARPETGLWTLHLEIQGLHCAACVWLLDELLRRRTREGQIVINSSTARVRLTVPTSFDVRSYIDAVESFGYRLGPVGEQDGKAHSGLIFRFGLSVAIAMNTMIFAIANYAGLTDGPIHRMFQAIVFALTTLNVVVGGSIFVRSALASLRHRALHLDTPIALGILLAYTSSTWNYIAQDGRVVFFDTLNVFISLMLLGRLLQERIVEKNKRSLLSTTGAEHLFAKRIAADRTVEVVRATELKIADRLLLAPGALVPLQSVLLGDLPSAFRLDWISGESDPVSFSPGSTVPAGAIAAGAVPVEVAASEDFARSTLVEVLRTPSKTGARARSSKGWELFVKYYVAAVLVLASSTFLGWFIATGNVARALEPMTALLIVTCPCALGIAIPLAYDLAQGGLRSIGFFVRSEDLLDRLSLIRRIGFDKTGTLTERASLREHQGSVEALQATERSILFSLAVGSLHPKAEYIRARLAAEAYRKGLTVTEVEGKGVELVAADRVYRLGAATFATAAEHASEHDASVDLVFSCDGVTLVSWESVEELRGDASSDVGAFRNAGFGLFLLSGDRNARVDSIARELGIPTALGERSPEAKAEWIRTHHPEETLFLGDGANDNLAVKAASVGGSVLLDRPFLANVSDFYLMSPGLRPLRIAMAAAHRLRKVTRLNIALAFAYNALTISLSVMGKMSPLLCAIVMPVSSISSVLLSTFAFSPRRSLWRS
ncbi:MAG: heavy metal translocating P-type ATPase metal-binding domain-containing protein [Polyangiaceae bacterium]|nr:heavy metal translocating P-type ATPase metal-binding domain-containing protein [Polyangiaceae bacterium]